MSVPTPTSCATLLLRILFYALHYIQEPPPPFSHLYHSLPLFPHHLHPSISCRSLSAGPALLCRRHTWAVASVWKLGLFAFKHSALWALGKLDKRRASVAAGRGGKEQGEVERERKRERSEGSNCTSRVQDREELRGVKKCVENTG